VAVEQLRPGLHRWTARHPAWRPGAEPGSPGDWGPEVGCVAFAVSGGIVVIDPQVPADEENAFWAEMDTLVAAGGGGVWMLQTLRWHGRSRARFVERYGASCPPVAAVEIEGVKPLPFPDADETMVWLEGPRALIAGDRLIGAAGGGVRMCPQSWLDYLPNRLTVDRLRELLLPLLDLPVELILVSHGEPVLADGHAELRAALDA
jgi:hypothetical protein